MKNSPKPFVKLVVLFVFFLSIVAREASGAVLHRNSGSATMISGFAPNSNALTINTGALAPAVMTVPYTTSLSASGGTASYSWSVSSGSLPAGLTLDASSGRITGIPTVSGNANFILTVTDRGNPLQISSKVFSIKTLTRLAISSSVALSTISGSAYTARMQASGGSPSYTWSVSSGQLPDGVALNPNSGVISGTVQAPGTSDFVLSVTDNGNPAQTVSEAASISAVSRLTISPISWSAGMDAISYSLPLKAQGGVPAYTWSVSAGSLPAGLSLAPATGVISGIPTTVGTANFVIKVVDSGPFTQSVFVRGAIKITLPPPPSADIPGTAWYIRTDGGTRYSANMPYGQCDGKADTAYSGVGINQHCAFNDFRFLWDDKSGRVGSGAWVIAGGDTVIVRGCTAGPGQTNASNPDCRLGWDAPTGTGDNLWCYGVGSYTCYNPPIPAGTATQHTRILGQNSDHCNVGGANDPKQYVSNLTQLFAGFSLTYALNLQNTQYVDLQCIELTTHNGRCTTSGSPAYPRQCNNNQPLDDFAANGILTNNKSSNITLQDVYVHGFNSAGFTGPIGGPIAMTRVSSNFNAFAGWNFSDAADTPDAPGSQILASYVTMIGNGCYEEYPVKHDFSAQACYDDGSNGFGDAWSGQDTDLDTFVCDHCVMAYNTKDGFIGPHTNVHTLTITNSQSYGNMGAQWKWNNTPNATVTFENNLTVGNCARLSEALPGAVQTFGSASNLPGAYLSDYCRAGGNTVAINSQQNSNVSFANNTFVDYVATVFLLSCGPQGNNVNHMCGTTPFVFTNNIFLGYHLDGSAPPGLFYIGDPSIKVTQNNNIAYGNRPETGEVCQDNSNVCADPMLVNEPVQQAWTNHSFLDSFTFKPTYVSPAIGAGTTYNGMLPTDYSGVKRPTPPTVGALEP